MEPTNDHNMCAICCKESSKYTCPRCNIQYCCLECYKHEAHSDCSESFYRDWFVEGMKTTQMSDENKKRMLEMLDRVEQENPVTDPLEHDSIPSIEERLDGLDLNSIDESKLDELWNRLSSEEKEQFQLAVKSGKIFDDYGKSLAALWKPWWCIHQSSHIVELDSEDQSEPANPHPDILLNIPDFDSMLSRHKIPSPFIVFNIVNILYPYVLFQRFYNGCAVIDFPLEFCDCCMNSSEVLSKNKTFSNAEESLINATDCCCITAQKQEFSIKETALIEAINDICHIVLGPDKDNNGRYVCAALSELYITFKKSRHLLKSTASGNNSEKKLKFFQSMKKLEFLLAWSTRYNAQFTVLSIELHELYLRKLRESKAQTTLEKSVMRHKKYLQKSSTQPLVTEID